MTMPRASSRMCRALPRMAPRSISPSPAFTKNGAAFHLAVAEASHNRVLAIQLQSLQHVSWPRSNPTLNRAVAAHVLEAHRELARLIQIRDPAGARRLMDEHVKMIRARRIAERGDAKESFDSCC